MNDQKYTIRDMMLMSLFAALTAILSWIFIPLPVPVDVTAQTFGPMLAGILLGPRKGAMSQVIYILLGVIGLPVFSGGRAGAAVLFGEGGGYLVGFVVGCYVIGILHERLVKNRKTKVQELFFSFVSVFTGGVIVVYLFGVPWLMVVLGFDLVEAVIMGAVVFLPGDIVKAVAAVLLSRYFLIIKESGIFI